MAEKDPLPARLMVLAQSDDTERAGAELAVNGNKAAHQEALATEFSQTDWQDWMPDNAPPLDLWWDELRRAIHAAEAECG